MDEKLDNGKIVSQKSFFINPNDNEEDLKRKTQKIEYKIYPEAIINLFRYLIFKKNSISFFAFSFESIHVQNFCL